jgi:probable DNA repair protein
MEHEPTKGPAAEPNQELVEWLKAGNLVVAASERAARALTAAYNRARRAEGLTGWPAATIVDWQTFVRDAWLNRNSYAHNGDRRMVLSGFQEQGLWAEIIAVEGNKTALLEGPRHQLAALALEAHRLLCNYAPDYLSSTARSAWHQDAAAFSNWLSAFDQIANASDLVSEARLPWELANSLAKDTSSRPALLLAGFDRILPTQRRVFDAWGSWREASVTADARHLQYSAAADQAAELAACAQWCKVQLDANPHARLLVVTQDVASRRGEMERAFLRTLGGNANVFEFSLGVPLRQTALARSAYLVLRWLSGAIEEHEIDWLFSTGHLAAGLGEARALAGFMRALRRRGMERTRWQFKDFIAQRPGVAILPTAWLERMARATRQLQDASRSTATPLHWSELVPRLLRAAGWPGGRSLTSGEFQALRRWQQELDACATLGFNGQRTNWNEFLSSLSRVLDETLFAPESLDAPIQITGPAESAGLAADAIWMMGASEDRWPAGGSTNPLLPISVQRKASMPHSLAQLDWDLAQFITARIAASAAMVHFSYPLQVDGISIRPSRLIERMAGPPQPLPAELCVPTAPEPRTEMLEDRSRVPLSSTNALGGSNVLSWQSQCPFKAFAKARLDAEGWQPAQAGLTSSQRGQLLHAVLHSVWAGKPDGIRTHADLVAVIDIDAFVERHVRLALRQKFYLAAAEFMPRRYLELEAVRLSRLVTEWLEFERTRAAFSVARTEFDTDATVAGLELHLRIDRIDKLNDGSLLVIDYKSGDVSPSLWALARPEDVQLPLYACFGLNQELRETIAHESGETLETEDAGCLGGLVFAKVRPGEVCFAGRVGNAQETLHPGTSKFSALTKYPLDAAELLEWRDKIEQLSRDFVAGHAAVDPRDAETCRRCDLQSLCRIAEKRVLNHDEEDSDD